jgi:hypothetical protein
MIARRHTKVKSRPGGGEASAPEAPVVEQIPESDHDRLLASEKAKADQAVHHSAETVRLLEAEQAKVRELLEGFLLGLYYNIS